MERLQNINTVIISSSFNKLVTKIRDRNLQSVESFDELGYILLYTFIEFSCTTAVISTLFFLLNNPQQLSTFVDEFYCMT